MIIEVTKNERIDKYLSENTEYSRNTIQKMIDSGLITVNGKNTKNNYILLDEDIVKIEGNLKEEMDVLPENIPLDIIYEDDDLMVINKPSGMVVHPANGNYSKTLVNALMFYTKNLSDKEEFRPGIVHRIDKDTSGLMIVAKNNKTHELLSEGFKNKTIERKYIALVVGNLESDKAVIDAPIGRDPKDRKKMAVVSDGKKARTNLEVLKRYQKYTLIKLKLDTGRTHQIRVHMKYINHPVYNDPVYTNKECTPFGQFLHSSELDFTHPITKKHLHFEVPLPKEFQDFIDNLI